MLSEALPIYSGGLGNVAGDQLKAASDLGVPVVGVGLLYQQGYFRQMIDKDGAQQALFPYNDPGAVADHGRAPVRMGSGCGWRSRCLVTRSGCAPGRSRSAGRGSICSTATTRRMCRRTAGSRASSTGAGRSCGSCRRSLLGIGGWRLLREVGIQPDVCHLNEGHAAFAVLERARAFMEETGEPFEVALAVTRAGNLFTTHTAVPAGFDRFSPALIEQYLGRYARTKLGHHARRVYWRSGVRIPADASRASTWRIWRSAAAGAVNGVSRLHGDVSRRLFAPLFPRWPEEEVPVGHVTNGVHVPTWDSAAADDAVDGGLRTRTAGWGPANSLDADIRAVSDAKLWQLRTDSTAALVEYARERLARQLAAAGATPEAVEEARHLFDPDALTLGFARRFATYKRPNLLLHDPERLLRILTNPRASGAAHHRRQGPPGGPGRAGHDPGMDPFHPPDRGAPARRFSSATTTCCSPSSWCRAWTSGSTRPAGPGKPAERAA